MAAAAPAPLSDAARSRLKPEQLLQVECIEELRPRLVPGAKLIAMNGELPGGSRVFRLWQAIKRAMGYDPGTPDLQALHKGRAYFIELKRARSDPDLLGHRKARGELSPQQREWRAWAEEHGYGWAVVRSVVELESALINWGLIPPTILHSSQPPGPVPVPPARAQLERELAKLPPGQRGKVFA